jgi:hypothetical protein
MEGAAVLAIIVEWMLGMRVTVLISAPELLAYCQDLARIRSVYRWTDIRALRIDVSIARAGRLHFQSATTNAHQSLRVLLGCMRAAVLIHGDIFGLELRYMPEFGEHVQDADAERDRHMPRMRAAALAIQQPEVDNGSGDEVDNGSGDEGIGEVQMTMSTISTMTPVGTFDGEGSDFDDEFGVALDV